MPWCSKAVFLLSAVAACAPGPRDASHKTQSVASLVVEREPEIFQPHHVSREQAEVKLTISPDGNRMAWGTIGWEHGVGGWDIWESTRVGETFGEPIPVSFNSRENDFDPSFSPDGRGLYFFSNRLGGLGGDDIWYVAIDPATGRYGAPMNLGDAINTPHDEWGPVIDADGTSLLFASDGRGGFGKHDLFRARRARGDESGWAAPENLGAGVNSALDDFDVAPLCDGRALVFASETPGKDEARLFVSVAAGATFGARGELAGVNTDGTWTFGASVARTKPGMLFFTSHRAASIGRTDIYHVPYRCAAP